MVNVVINQQNYEVDENKKLLEILRNLNIFVPSLCFLKDINESNDCRMCLVKHENNNQITASCALKPYEGMIINTDLEDVKCARQNMLELIVSNHHFDCMNCPRDGKCELKKLCNILSVDYEKYTGEKNNRDIDLSSNCIIKDNNKCILCKRCLNVCKKVEGIGAIDITGRGFTSKVGTAYEKCISDVNCVSCGQCTLVCPTGALAEKSSLDIINEKLSDKNYKVIVQTAPSIRAALGEEFDMEIGENVTGKMVSALRSLGFYKAFDMNTGADFTIMEEALELVTRIEENKTLPMITSCSPAWINLLEKYYPELIGNVSSCKSPHQMLGAIIKSYYAEKEKLDKTKIFNVSVMPCTSKKDEIERKQNMVDGIKDVDAVITTRELAKLIKSKNIDFVNLKDEEFDNPLGLATGAGAIFGVSGGVMEAAIRTAKYLLGDADEKLVYEDVRDSKGIKESSIKINAVNYNVAIISGLANARKVLDELKNGKCKYHFIEIMSCPGGCIMGGGQPRVDYAKYCNEDVRSKRAKALYNIDDKSDYRKSHENPVMQEVYLKYIGKPGKGLAHKLLHTSYEKQDKYKF